MNRRTRLKICGMSEPQPIQLAVELGVDALGFIFYPKSPRNVTAKQVRKLTANIPPFVNKVGVFVKQSPKEILEIVKEAGLDTIQLHGDYDQKTVLEISSKIHLPIILALRVNNLDNYFIENLNLKAVSSYLIDKKVQGAYGGTGERVQLDLENLSEKSRKILSEKVILAGGLKPHHLTDIIPTYHPFGIDISSGVEKQPGKKSLSDIRKLFEIYHSISNPS